MTKVHRSELTGAPYNPRTIGDRQRAALKESLRKNGLIAPLVWNRRTGNLVGGHQRMELMDSLLRTKNYTLDVAEVDMSEAEEVAANIALNNANAMGEFDYGAVQSLATDYGLDLQKDFLFDRDDMLVSFGMDLEDAHVQVRNADTTPELMQELKDRKKLVRERLQGAKAEVGDYTSTAMPGVLTLVFNDDSQKRQFCTSVGLSETVTTIHAERVLDLTDMAPDNDSGIADVSIAMMPDELAAWERLKKKLKAPDDKLAILKLLEQAGIDVG